MGSRAERVAKREEVRDIPVREGRMGAGAERKSKLIVNE
jgi:hypothetical protein